MGHTSWHTGLDLLHVIMVGVSNDMPERSRQNELHCLLCALFSDQMTSSGILNILEQEYNIPITEELGEEVNTMCNLGEGIAERAEARGRQQGRQEGRKEGRKEGHKEGRRQATTEFVINLYRNHHVPDEIAMLLGLNTDDVSSILVQQGLLRV